MPTYTKQPLSAAISGQQIQITGATAIDRTLIHTSVNNSFDEVWLYATNTSSGTTLNLTTTWCLTGLAGQMTIQIPPIMGRVLLTDGKMISGSANSINAFATSGNFINIDGFVNRIT